MLVQITGIHVEVIVAEVEVHFAISVVSLEFTGTLQPFCLSLMFLHPFHR